MNTGNWDRRHFLRAGGALSVLGTAAPFALQMAAVGSAAGQSAPDYKALVCLFMFGGNDANNMLLATDTDSWTRYYNTRNIGDEPIALMPVGTPATAVGQVSAFTKRTVEMNMPEAWGGVLPIVPNTVNPVPAGTVASARSFALHPALGPLRTLFNSGRLAAVANIGTLVAPVTKAAYQAKTATLPLNLFSHNDQVSTWQSGKTEGTKVGWGGRFADLLASMNGNNTIFTGVSLAGNAVFLAGQSIAQYQITTGCTPAVSITGTNATSVFGSSVAPSVMRDIIQSSTNTNLMGADYNDLTARSISAAAGLNAAFQGASPAAIPAPSTYVHPSTGVIAQSPLALQLQSVAKMIAAGPSLGLKRQVFFVGIGGFDNHDYQNDAQPGLLTQVAHAMSYFDGVLGNIGGLDMRANVTTFTASDFSRTFATNGDGTDHAWGGHHFVMGGAVKGKDIYGQFPTVGLDKGSFNNPDFAGSIMIPRVSVDQYGATMGRWLGASDSDLKTIFPNLKNFNTPYLGFL